MKTTTLTSMMTCAWKAMRKHSPEILTALGIAGFTTAAVMAVKVTPKALEKVRQDSQKNHNGDRYAYTKKEAVVSAWRHYVPAVGIGLSSAACLIFATSTNLRRNAALATAYSISEATLRDYQAKTLEMVGPEKEQEIRNAAIKERTERQPIQTDKLFVTRKGETLCYDPWSDRLFKSDPDFITKAANSLSREMLDSGYVSLNDFYYEIGLTETKAGNELGWKIDKGLIDPIFSGQLTQDQQPCLAIDFRVQPAIGFDE